MLPTHDCTDLKRPISRCGELVCVLAPNRSYSSIISDVYVIISFAVPLTLSECTMQLFVSFRRAMKAKSISLNLCMLFTRLPGFCLLLYE